MKPNGQPTADIEALFDEGTAIDAALKAAVREAVLRHKRLGQPIVEWRDGRAVLTPPEEIVVEEPPAQK
ncbi:MAG TPA: hypothetical protein VFI31_23145 [Pirellulales bacterium]|nr:hypothetical protein [Pirellulales bacterium]